MGAPSTVQPHGQGAKVCPPGCGFPASGHRPRWGCLRLHGEAGVNETNNKGCAQHSQVNSRSPPTPEGGARHRIRRAASAGKGGKGRAMLPSPSDSQRAHSSAL
ncbi:hypothetical protein NDU88_004786 [Pleurodeles waltl]|uniref:Uncharacterized protein n=1 Tax=Pleurodeles waltl TaxID=8319 RepID=A0AAV7RH74_PLEWA|nr:hypothetical protein NDU88_004786 [Pleurodeles waltl]